MKKTLLSDNLVTQWIGNLHPHLEKDLLHSSRPEAYENAMGKLYEFGLRKDTTILDKKTEPFRHWLAQQTDLPDEGYFPVFHATLVASFLSMTGYSEEEAVHNWILKRLETTYPFAKNADLSEVYIPQDTFPGYPKPFRNTPLINPDLCPDRDFKLPWIHDINAFLHSTPIMHDPQLREKVETVIKLILKPEYQKLHPGYGTIRAGPRRYHKMGWDIRLPGYQQTNIRNGDFSRLLLRLSMMSRSKAAREHPWFKHSLTILEKYRTEDGLTSFPRKLLPKKKIGYWILGRRMALETKRNSQKAIKCESTFRVLETRTRTKRY